MIEKFSHSRGILNEIPGMKSGRSLYSCIIGYEKNKEINKPLSENEHTMIEITC